MQTLSAEQFKKQYGENAITQFAEMNNKRFTPKERGVAKDFGIGMAKGAADTVFGMGNIVNEGIKRAPSGLSPLMPIAKKAQNMATGAGLNPFEGENQEKILDTLKADNTTQKAGKVAEFAIEAFFPVGYVAKGVGLGEKVGTKAMSLADSVVSKAQDMTQPIMQSNVVSGAVQKGKEMIDRVPRFISRVSEGADEAAIKAQKIKTSEPAIANAYKVGLDERYINTVAKADNPTKQAYREILDIADNPSQTLKQGKRPEIVAGNAVADQAKVIYSQKKKIGEQIGEQIEKLGKSNVKADMGVAFRQIDNVLAENGIQIGKDGTLSSLKYTDKEMAIIQDLYNKAHKGGNQLTALQVRDIDNLFSKLQREARVEQLGNIFVKANGQDMNIFRLFRDVYTNQLENIAPEIRDLNRQYRNFSTLTDDIEDTIIKSGKYETTKNVDDAEFAQTNLRRLFSEANSAADYRAIYEEMDALSRALGYSGARADDLAAFAYELRKLYPEVTPRTGFEGGIRATLGDFVETVTKLGAPNAEDQRKALRALLENR